LERMGLSILLVYDGTEPSIKALSYAYSMLDRDSRLTILYIIDLDKYMGMMVGAEAAGRGSELVNRAISEVEVKVRKQLSEYSRACSEKGATLKCLVTVGRIAEKILEEAAKGNYDLLILPIGKLYEEKMSHVLSEVIKSYRGNILIIK